MKTQKTKKSFKKKALLSSLSMLMVATVAVGSATFAWFTSSTSATAKDINVKTTKSSEIKVAKADFDFKDEISYGMTSAKNLRPVTSADGNNWFSTVAGSKDSYEKAATSSYTPQTTGLDNYLWTEMLNVKNAGETACSVEIDVEATKGVSGFARVAIIPCATAQSEANVMPATTKDDFKAHIYGSAASDTWKPYNGTAVEAAPYSTIAAVNGTKLTISNLGADKVASYKLMVWFEGEDSDCFDTNTATTFAVPEIKFTVTGTTATN